MVKTRKPLETIVNIAAPLLSARGSEWLAEAAERVKSAHIQKRRMEERTKGPLLEAGKLRELIDEDSRLASEIAVRNKRREEIKGMLRAHWGHTGATEFEGSAGKTSIVLSFTWGVVQESIEQNTPVGVWRIISRRVIQPARLLLEAQTRESLRTLVVQNLRLGKLSVAVRAAGASDDQSSESNEEEAVLEQA